MSNTQSSEYRKAIAKNDAAIERFRAIRNAHLAGQLADDQFFSAKAEYDAAMTEFDAAFTKERDQAQGRTTAARFVGKLPTGADFEDAGGKWNQDYLTWVFPDGSYGRMEQSGEDGYAFVMGLAEPGFELEATR